MPTTSDRPPTLSFRSRLRYWWRKIVRPVTKERKAEVQIQMRVASRPDFSFFLLVALSCIIATLGLLVNSPAIIIGAMLVAPLMSPIIGLGLSSLNGDDRLLRDSVSAILRGAVLAIIISFLVALFNRNLPFVVMHEIPREVIARTTPSPIDLGVALAGGLAAAFALVMPNISAALPGVAIATAIMPPLCTIGVGLAIGRLEIAGGALLLFLTNAVAITFASTLVFFSLGFQETRTNQRERVPRSLIVSAIFTFILLGSLSYLSYDLFQTATENRLIEEVVAEEVANIEDAELVEWTSSRSGDTLHLDIVLRTLSFLNYEDSVDLQKAIANRLQIPVSVVISQVRAAELDPLIPPTPMPTDTPSPTSTLGPSPTLSPTSTPTSTSTSTPTETYTPTATPTHTPTPTFTSTHAIGLIQNTALPGLRLRQYPGGPEIAALRSGQPLTVFHKKQAVDGLIWVQVEDAEGRIGWIPEIYLKVITLTPTITSTTTPTVDATFDTVSSLHSKNTPTTALASPNDSPTTTLSP